MTVKEAILKSLEDLIIPVYNVEVYNHIVEKKYSEFLKGKTPGAKISAQLGDYIRSGDSRVKRIKKSNGIYYYYLTKNEQLIETEILNDENIPEILINEEIKIRTKVYEERDLHKLLSSFLKNTETFSKTIFHEQSNGKDSNQIWTHPDMVAIKFLNLQTKASQNFLKSINRVDTFKLSSYELKREINSEVSLKKPTSKRFQILVGLITAI